MTLVKASYHCPSCQHLVAASTDLASVDTRTMNFTLTCPRCQAPFLLNMLTGLTSKTTVPNGPAAGATVSPPPPPAPTGPERAKWAFGEIGSTPAAGADAPAVPTFAPLGGPAAPPPPPKKPAFAPLGGSPTAAVAPAAVVEAAIPPTRALPPVPPPPPNQDPMSTQPSADQPKQGFWASFNRLPAWQQWGAIVAVIALIGVGIFLSPLGESRDPNKAKPTLPAADSTPTTPGVP